MNRLTEKEEGDFVFKTYKPIECDPISLDAKVDPDQLAGYYDCLRKLGNLEDHEEKLGIDFITLYEALTNGVWVKNEAGQIYHTNIYLHDLTLSSNSAENNFCFITPDNLLLLFDRINQDWSLTKGKLL